MNRLHYQEAAKLMRTGDLIGTRDGGIVGRGIQRVTGHPINHVCGVVLIAGRRVVLQTTLDVNRVHAVPLSLFVRERPEAYWWPAEFNEIEQHAYTSELFAALGRKYEKPLLMLTRVALRRPFRENDRWFCSELETKARAAARESLRVALPSPQRSWPSHVVEAHGGMQLATQLIS